MAGILDKISNSVWGKDYDEEDFKEAKGRQSSEQVKVKPIQKQIKMDAKSRRHNERMLARRRQRGKWKKGVVQQDEYFDDEEEDKEETSAGQKKGPRDTLAYLFQSKDDDTGAQGVLGEILETEEERLEREREEKEEAERLKLEEQLKELELNQKDFPFEGDPAHTPGLWVAAWNGAKGVAFLIFVIVAFIINSTNYDKRVCVQAETASGLDQCLYYRSQFKCVGIDYTDPISIAATANPTTPYCADACASLNNGEGCMVFRRNVSSGEDTVLCISKAQFTMEFNETVFAAEYTNYTLGLLSPSWGCKDPYTCPDSAESDITNAILLAGVLNLISALFSVARGFGLFQFSGTHREEFISYEEWDYKRKGVFLCSKNGSQIQQGVFIATVLAVLFLLLQVFALGGSCANAQTSSGEPSQFPVETNLYVQYEGLMLGVMLLVGSYIRHNWKVRGELYEPSNEDEIQVPYNLDCWTQQQNEPPKCCHDTCDFIFGCCRFCGCKFCVSPCTAFWDCLCGPPLWFGNKISWLYKHRHFIGP